MKPSAHNLVSATKRVVYAAIAGAAVGAVVVGVAWIYMAGPVKAPVSSVASQAPRAIYVADAQGDAVVYPVGSLFTIDGKPYRIAGGDPCPASLGMAGACLVMHDHARNVPVQVADADGVHVQRWSYAVMAADGAQRVVYRTDSGGLVIPH